MLRLLIERMRQGHRTSKYPREKPILPDRFRGLHSIEMSRCVEGCTACSQACPTDAISRDGEGLRVDLGRCLFCTDCEQACEQKAISCSREHRLAANTRADLLSRGNLALAKPVREELRQLFGRSLKLRQVSAGGCNACEADINVLSTLVFDLGRFGIQVVASPRHADGLIVTGPVSENMKLALEKSYEALAEPKVVIAVGACAISGGPFLDHPEVHNGAESIVPVDLFIPGCPPHPMTILDGLLRFLGKKGEALEGQ